MRVILQEPHRLHAPMGRHQYRIKFTSKPDEHSRYNQPFARIAQARDALVAWCKTNIDEDEQDWLLDPNTRWLYFVRESDMVLLQVFWQNRQIDEPPEDV
ncbi:MAG: hypothetical protein EOP83_05140 [Verrucomicrobiaceae bacterium]|nr:MAG: hypothetical protein EOP83_05140 [Verrucomicrobiaceae bacterium]